MVDVISGGRLILGVGAGYAPEEFAAFGVSLKEIRRAGRLGDAWLGGPSARLDELADCVRLFREARTAAGREDGDVALIRYVFVAETAERARAIAGPAFIRAFEETYFRWPHRS